MLVDNIKVFDEFIKGTGDTWYSSSEVNGRLGSADLIYLQAIPTRVGGSTPKVTVAIEHSGDGDHWTGLTPVPSIDEAAMVEDQPILGGTGFPSPLVRLRISLSGSGPECRLVVFASLRSFAVGVSA
jgi:hypothetical protein